MEINRISLDFVVVVVVALNEKKLLLTNHVYGHRMLIPVSVLLYGQSLIVLQRVALIFHNKTKNETKSVEIE